MRPTGPEVTVVVPTTGRASLVDAVGSALAQEGVLVEVLVVVDAAPGTVDVRAVEDLVTVLWTGGGRGASAARNLGTRHGAGTWVAHLDDDDVWLADKLSRQLAVGRPLLRAGTPVLLSSRVTLVAKGATGPGLTAPRRTLPDDAGQDEVADYLFRGRGPRPDRNVVFSSTLLVDRASALLCPWEEDLPRHQDWDWVLHLAGQPGAVVRQLPDVLGEQRVGSPGSLSASQDWRASLRWGARWRQVFSRRTYADFLVGQSLRVAVSARSLRGVAAVLAELLPVGPPGPAPVVLALTALVPRHLLVRAALARPVRRAAHEAVVA